MRTNAPYLLGKRWCTTQKQEDHAVAWAIEIEPFPGLMNKSPCLQRQMQRPLGGSFPGPGALRRKELKFSLAELGFFFPSGTTRKVVVTLCRFRQGSNYLTYLVT